VFVGGLFLQVMQDILFIRRILHNFADSQGELLFPFRVTLRSWGPHLLRLGGPRSWDLLPPSPCCVAGTRVPFSSPSASWSMLLPNGLIVQLRVDLLPRQVVCILRIIRRPFPKLLSVPFE